MQQCQISPTLQQTQSLSLSPEQIRERIVPRLFSTIHQADRVKNLLFRHLAADIVLVWYADVSDLVPTTKDSAAYIPITKPLADNLGLTVDDLMTLGASHMSGSYRVQSLGQVMGSLLGVSEEMESAVPMYVVGVKNLSYGATAILDSAIQADLNTLCPEGFFLLPSSIHEMLAVPKAAADPADLARMVQEINHAGDVVAESDILSDHVFTLTDGRLVAVV